MRTGVCGLLRSSVLKYEKETKKLVAPIVTMMMRSNLRQRMT
jgi:hypothetical protein